MNPSREELFRFLSVRQPEKVKRHRIATRIVRDLRENGPGSLHHDLFAAGSFDSRLARARKFLEEPGFIGPDGERITRGDRAADFLRGALVPLVAFEDLAEDFAETYPWAAGLLKSAPDAEVAKELAAFNGTLWDSFYALTVVGFDAFVSTNYLADSIRVLHVMRLMWLTHKAGHESWRGHAFDDYELLISPIAGTGQGGKDDPPGQMRQPVTDDRAAERDRLRRELDDLRRYDEMLNRKPRGFGMRRRAAPTLDRRTRAALNELDLPKGFDTEAAPASAYRAIIEDKRIGLREELRKLRNSAADGTSAKQVAASAPLTPVPGFFSPETLHVELDVGRIRPPLVGDMILVEQELSAYELGELANIENVLKGEKREHTTRNLSRNTQTTSSSSETETSESESLKTDERFQLTNESSKEAENAFSADIGVSVSGKYGPVKIAVDANASFSMSRSSAQEQSQEFSRQVTEEAAKSVRRNVKEASSLTIMSELEKTSRHGFDNFGGTGHIAGLYRWVDKLYYARSVNYGRRMMITFDVSEPAAMLHAMFEEQQEEAHQGLEEPLPPAAYAYHDRHNEVMEVERVSNGVPLDNHGRLTAENYAALAAKYGVSDIAPPPPNKITSANAISYPATGEATNVQDHQQDGNELSYVSADNTLKVDPAYEVRRIGVYASEGRRGSHSWYANTLLMGMRKNDENTLLVLVGNKSFYFNAAKDGNDNREISTNFNSTQEVNDKDLFAASVVDTIPITIQADFEGLFSFNVIYTAFLRDSVFEEWQIATWAAILKGYERKKQQYEQALKLAEHAAQGETEAVTHVLRDSQYRDIEQTELKRACVDILTEGSAMGRDAISFDGDNTPTYPTENGGPGFADRRTPLTNGVIAAFFEEAFEWDQMTYRFYPYYWSHRRDWHALRAMTSPDPTFESFLTSGQSSVTVSVKPGSERAVLMFLRTGRVWSGGYLGLFDNIDMLTVFDDVENGIRFDPPIQIGDPWPVRVPTSLIKLQADDTLPEFEISFSLEPAEAEVSDDLVIDADSDVPF